MTQHHATLPSQLPANYSKSQKRIWRALEYHARGTLLAHGSRALKFTGDGSNVDPIAVIAEMIEAGVLKPCKVDIAGADRSVVALMGTTWGGSKGTNHIKNHKWCTGFALLWTYEPVNRCPMIPDEETKELLGL